MLQRVLLGIIAGAAGTMALDITTYGDMFLRGRPPAASPPPSPVVWPIRSASGFRQRRDRGKSRQPSQCHRGPAWLRDRLRHRRRLRLIRGRGGRIPTPLAGTAVGILAMVASDLPIALSGASDPRTWTPVDWLSDLIPHLVYGLVTVQTYEFIASQQDA